MREEAEQYSRSQAREAQRQAKYGASNRQSAFAGGALLPLPRFRPPFVLAGTYLRWCCTLAGAGYLDMFCTTVIQ
jgi:hypothetical protein